MSDHSVSRAMKGLPLPGEHIQIIGDHPWAKCTGTVLPEIVQLPFGNRTVMAKVRLDACPEVPRGHECMVSAGHWKPTRRSK